MNKLILTFFLVFAGFLYSNNSYACDGGHHYYRHLDTGAYPDMNVDYGIDFAVDVERRHHDATYDMRTDMKYSRPDLHSNDINDNYPTDASLHAADLNIKVYGPLDPKLSFDAGLNSQTGDISTNLTGGGGCDVGQNPGGASILLILSFLLIVYMRKYLSLILFALVLLASSPVKADGLPVLVPTFSPKASPYSYYKVDSAFLLKHGDFATQLYFNIRGILL